MLKEKGGDGMYQWLHGLLADRKDGVLFSCFGPWHFGYIAVALAAATVALLYLKNKPQAVREKVMRRVLYGAFFLYVADFFRCRWPMGRSTWKSCPFMPARPCACCVF